MTVWCHLPTISNWRRFLRFVGIPALLVALITTLVFSSLSHAAAGVNQTLSFQGRLLSASGAVAPDGYYNIQFKIYQDGTGTAAGDPDGSLKWTESYVNNDGTSGVEVKDGFFSVDLGSQNPFGTSVDWNQDTLWLSMDVAGSDASCTTFGTTPCTDDGEMLPMKRITSTPYSLNSGQLDGKTADNFIQLAQGVQTDASTNTSSIFINKTSTGNLIQLQNAATDVFTVGNAGDLTLGSNANKTISISTAAADTAGKSLSVVAGAGGSGTGSTGGDLILQGGGGGGTDGGGGNVQIDAGVATGTGTTGTIAIGTANASAVTIGRTDGSSQTTINGATSISDGTLTVAGTISSSSGYQINGATTLTGSSLSFTGSGTSTITSADAQALDLNGNAGVTIQSGSVTSASFTDTNIQVGSGSGSGTPTLLTVDKSSSAPSVDSSLVGSMYYDTTLGELQCYEASGWGACSNSPNQFVTLSPTYAGAVMHGTDTGTMTTDMCSDSLNINDGSSSQPTICGTNETYNYYDWTSTNTSDSTRSIFVTYQLPSNFKGFVDNSTSLMGRTDSTDSTVAYQIYRNNSTTGLTACGASIPVSTGVQTTWQKGAAADTTDPANCSFAAGDSIVFKVDLTAKNSANAYASTLNFTLK